jgi:hypothetical protein
MPRNPRSVDLKAWYQIHAKLHMAFESILTCKVIKMRPTNWSFKNYVAHGTATADDDDNVLIHGISHFLIHEHANCGHDLTPTFPSSITTKEKKACFQENWIYGITHKPSFIIIKEMKCNSIIPSQTKHILII